MHAGYFKKGGIMGIYCGGGTPTLCSLKNTVESIKHHFSTLKEFPLNVESTLESLNKDKLLELKETGVTRLLIGIQSFDKKVLEKINRLPQDKAALEKVIDFCREIGIEHINIELVAGLPCQTKDSFLDDLRFLVNLGVDSIHCYPLLITPLTGLWKNRVHRKIYGPSLRTQKMWQEGASLLRDNGYRYKGDDFCLDDTARNPLYTAHLRDPLWGGVIGLGVSALSHFTAEGGARLLSMNALGLGEYFKAVDNSHFPADKGYFLDAEETLRQFLIKACRYGQLNTADLKKRLGRRLEAEILRELFKREFKLFGGKDRLCYDSENKTIYFSRKDWWVNSKSFFSEKVLKECKEKIRESDLCRFGRLSSDSLSCAERDGALKKGEPITVHSRYELVHKDFPEQMFMLKRKLGRIVKALLDGSNCSVSEAYPEMHSSIHFRKKDFGANILKKEIRFSFKNNLRKVEVSLRNTGVLIIKQVFYDFKIRKLWSGGCTGKKMHDTYKNYLLGWTRYLANLRAERISEVVAGATEAKIQGNHKESGEEPKAVFLDGMQRWDIAFIEESPLGAVIRIPLPIERKGTDAYFARIISHVPGLGFISKIIAVHSAGDGFYIEPLLQDSGIIVDKVFSIDKHAQSAYLLEDKLPVGISYKSPELTQDLMRRISQQAGKRRALDMNNLPKAIMASMGPHTDPAFASITESAVYPVNNHYSFISSYFKGSFSGKEFHNLELNIEQGAAIIQLNYVSMHKENDDFVGMLFSRAARLCVEAGAGAVCINLSWLLQAPYGGVKMMARPKLCRRVVASVANTIDKKVPLLVKIRSGFDQRHKNAVKIAEIIEQAGADAVIVFAQTPDEGYYPPFNFDYETVRTVKERLRIPVIANGGIDSPEKAEYVLSYTNADAVIIGRAAVIEPRIVKRTAHYLSAGEILPPYSALEILELAKKHLRLALRYYGREFDFELYMQHFMCGYIHRILYAVPEEKQGYVARTSADVDSVEELKALFIFIEKELKKEPVSV